MTTGLNDALNHSANIAVPFMFDLCAEIGDMTWLWSNVKRGRADRHDVVDLARMNDADKLVAHHDDVQVRRRQRTRKLVQRLIRQTLHVAQSVLQSKIANLRLFASAADKTERNVITSL